jgi:hypothetical protein
MADLDNSNSIWIDDLFERKQEAEQIHAYIQSVAGRPIQRQDKSAFTFAVEGSYGQGKTFFLKRLATQLSENHPVAYCDAWADDFADEPLTALAATLKEALGQFKDRTKVDTFLAKTGKVTKIIGKGLLRRSAGLLITDAAVGAVESLDFKVEKTRVGDLEKLSDGVADDLADDRSDEEASDLMLERIDNFQEKRRAVSEVKSSLLSIVRSLESQGLEPPIVIVIDELDRCRPSYAIKLLEEIKHLFDVPGVVFILGMNSEQLGHSISGVYGANFDGHAYLKRFVDRAYTMRDAPLENLLRVLWKQSGLNSNQFELPQIVIPQVQSLEPDVPGFIAEIMKHYGLGARDAFGLIDILQTSATLVSSQKITLAYYLPLVIGAVRGLEAGKLPEPKNPTRWHYLTTNWRQGNEGTPVQPHAFANEIKELLKLPSHELYERANSNDARAPEIIASRAKSITRVQTQSVS